MTVNYEDAVRPPYVTAYNMLKLLGVPVFVNEDHAAQGNFGIDAEDERAEQWVVYYHAPANWSFGVSPVIDDILDQFGLFAEWVNPGSLGVYES